MNSGGIQVLGLQELERKMKALGPMIARKALKGSLIAGLREVRREAQSLAPEKTGRLKRAMYIKVLNKFNPFKQNVIFGVRHGKDMQKVSQKRFGKRGLDAFYWRFQEFDHKVRGKKARSKYERMAADVDGTKVIPGNHFMTKAFEVTKERALVKFKEALSKNIQKLVSGGVR